MRDMHSHILPGVDDGARDLEMSLAMIGAARRAGVTSIVCTPHARDPYFDYESMWSAYHELCRHTNMPLSMGFEVAHQKLMELGAEEWAERLAIQGTGEFLLELDFGCSEADFRVYERTIFELQGRGLAVVIAHPERYACVQESPERVNGWMKKGCLAQINRGSVFGRFGGRAKECADALLEQRWVTCIASDAHKPYERTPYMADIKEYMEERFSYRYSRELLYENPRKILMGSASAENNRSEIVS